MTQFLQKGSQIPKYMAYPRFLLSEDLSETAKLVYILLLDRARLSMKNGGWEDERGHVFICYTIADLAGVSGKSEMTVKNALRTLEQRELICRKKQGAGMPNRIYVKVQTENCPTRGVENCLTGGTTFDPQTDRKLSANNNKSKYREQYTRIYDYEEGDSL